MGEKQHLQITDVWFTPRTINQAHVSSRLLSISLIFGPFFLHY